MRIVGIDPGKTVGLCLYDTEQWRAVAAGQCLSAAAVPKQIAVWSGLFGVDAIAIERPRLYSKGGNEIADTIEQFGALWSSWAGPEASLPCEVVAVSPGAYRIAQGRIAWALERRAVVGELSELLACAVKGDAGVWAALVELHGGKGVADNWKKSGSGGLGALGVLAGLPHAKAAAAVAFVAGRKEERCGR